MAACPDPLWLLQAHLQLERATVSFASGSETRQSWVIRTLRRAFSAAAKTSMIQRYAPSAEATRCSMVAKMVFEAPMSHHCLKCYRMAADAASHVMGKRRHVYSITPFLACFVRSGGRKERSSARSVSAEGMPSQRRQLSSHMSSAPPRPSSRGAR